MQRRHFAFKRIHRRELVKNMNYLLLTILSFAITSTANAWTSWIGTLEDWPNKSSDKPEGTITYESRIRPLFYKKDNQPWKAAPRSNQVGAETVLPKAFSWDVCFGGRGEGSITGILEESKFGTPVPPYALRPEDRAPWRTRRSLDYAGWIQEPVYKPILLSSSMNSTCKDPEKWRGGPGDKSKPYLPAMLTLLDKQLAFNAVPTTVSPSSVKIPHAWASPKQGRFAQLKASTVSGEPVSAVFYISTQGTNFAGFNMALIDAGDFDGNGFSEVLFKQRGDKQDIYVLFENGEKIAETTWDYP